MSPAMSPRPLTAILVLVLMSVAFGRDSDKSARPEVAQFQLDSDYGWEKLFSERIYLSFYRNYNIEVRIARYHNIFGQEGTFQGGREKSPAAICRKVAAAKDQDTIEIWGDGKQTRSYCHVYDCVEGTVKLCNSDYSPFYINLDYVIMIICHNCIAINSRKNSGLY